MSEAKPKKLLVSLEMAIGVLFDAVTIEIICGDDYEAQVLYDDLNERLQAGESITLSVTPALATPEGT